MIRQTLHDSLEGICSIQVYQGDTFVDWGDFPCIALFEKNSKDIGWFEVKNIDSKISIGDRIIFDRSLYEIEDKIDGVLSVKKDELRTSLLEFEDMGIPIQKGIMVPVSQPLQAEDSHFADCWVGKWVRNIAKNYDRICQGETISMIKNKCEKVPVVIVGAGPSLDKNIGELKDINAVIISTDRAYKPLLARGINPDLIISLDCHDDLILEYLNKVDSSNHMLVLNTAADYQIARMWQGRILYFNMAHKGMQFCDKVLPFLFPGHLAIQNAGCVVNTAIIIADWIKCRPTILVGCDFSYPDNKMSCDTYDYINGTFQKIEVNEEERFKNRSGKVNVRGIFTYPPFLGYLKTMKKWDETFKFNIVNATEGGIINCFTEMTLKKAKEKYCSKNIDRIKKNLNRR